VQWLSASLAAAGKPVKVGGVGWCSDAGWFGRVCRETVVFGPGSIGEAHTADEFIAVEQLEAGVAVLKDFMSRLADDLAGGV